jgi:ribosomal protein L37E
MTRQARPEMATAVFIQPLMIPSYEFDMVKKCEQCGAPAVDSQSLFCNLCGGYVRDEPEDVLPVCRICGIPAPDEQSAFCTRCGLKYPREPEDIYPVCNSCGSIVPDELAAFCNRCGEKISSKTEASQPLCATCGAPAVDEQTLFCNRCGTPFFRPGAGERQKKAAESVIITKKRRSPVPPAHRGAEVSETSLSNPPTSSLPVQPDTQAQKKFAHLPLQADENVPDIPRSKKYAHLPMVADELMIKDSSRHGHHSTDVHDLPAGRPKKHPSNKGLLDKFKR